MDEDFGDSATQSTRGDEDETNHSGGKSPCTERNWENPPKIPCGKLYTYLIHHIDDPTWWRPRDDELMDEEGDSQPQPDEIRDDSPEPVDEIDNYFEVVEWRKRKQQRMKGKPVPKQTAKNPTPPKPFPRNSQSDNRRRVLRAEAYHNDVNEMSRKLVEIDHRTYRYHRMSNMVLTSTPLVHRSLNEEPKPSRRGETETLSVKEVAHLMNETMKRVTISFLDEVDGRLKGVNQYLESLESAKSPTSRRKVTTALQEKLEEVDTLVAAELDRLEAVKERVNRVRRDEFKFDWSKAAPTAEPLETIKVTDAPRVPKSPREAVTGKFGKYFLRAMQLEMESIMNREVYTKHELPKDRKAISSKWVYDYKVDPSGVIKRFKARLVAMGNSQVKDVDYVDTHSPVVKAKVIRILMAMSAAFGMRIEQIDIKTAFLYGDLKEPNWMRLPRGFEEFTPEGKPLYAKLQKSLYGLHQAGREWWTRLDQFFRSNNFKRLKSETCTYIKVDDSTGKLIIVLIYVDDILIASTDSKVIKKVKDQIAKEFEITDLGEAKWILKIQVVPARGGGIWIGQKSYIRSILEEEGIWDVPVEKYKDTPMAVNWQTDTLSRPLDESESSRYKTVVAKLLYLSMQTRPDILYSVTILAQHQRNPKLCHMRAATRILLYLRKTHDLGLFYRKSAGNELIVFDSNLEELDASKRAVEVPEGMRETIYADASYGGEEDAKSRSSYLMMVFGAPVIWFSKKQPTTALSSTEAEVMALVEGIKEALWMRDFLEELGMKINSPTITYQDNQSVIAIAANPIHHARIKHMEIKTHFIRENIENGIVKLVYCPTELMIADVLTKPLPSKQHMELIRRMGMVSYTELEKDDLVEKSLVVRLK